MKYINELKTQYGNLELKLANYIAEYDNHGDDWRMTEISEQLELLRNLRFAFNTIIYPRLEAYDEMRASIKEARNEDAVLEELLETILNIHVDEPLHEYRDKLETLLRIVQAFNTIDRGLIDYLKSNFPEDQLTDIDAEIHQKMFGNISMTNLLDQEQRKSVS